MSTYADAGIDLDSRKVAALLAGQSYIPDVPSADVTELLSTGRLHEIA